ncbi:hypothetical protein GCM10009733_053700 [Nonomuraea maheshkhaliensis]|uniref:Pentapeptide repeat-containing protein n=1 Tax=Nonomuraea maheshkhaliensis TaxID=419590 RepID=A0ABN2FJH5_9ACTN
MSRWRGRPAGCWRTRSVRQAWRLAGESAPLSAGERAQLTVAERGAPKALADLPYVRPGADVRAAVNTASAIAANRVGNIVVIPDLSEVRFPRTDLSGFYPIGMDLSGADLRGADLTKADLTKADLTGTFLTGADLAGRVGALGVRK